ncbi:YppE family protein [Salipaludibacillus agaradhaerens]|uniref:YppE family protein n=1 Tax=Salipaludibacillus agaradhaerens TaxID=76935 RepID=UPI00215107E3|nr:YppE family protein [Salipaludibacillus agaradhaerens]MCR6106625.1 YppE family protein [Salipaludibacillus agaradhaerens]MCR6118658.1 YppE family protein [Salipaludibacillus agaradhaerens]UJW57739.1 YppE family protein [Bacillus sp. A116_S68]
MSNEEIEQLMKDTNKLKILNEQAYHLYHTFAQTEKEADFFHDVKPFADKVKNALKSWKPMVLKWIGKERPSYLHAEQIDQLEDNFEILAVTCFQKDAKKKKIMEQYKSIEYTLSLVEKSDS